MPLPPELSDTYRTFWAFAQQAAQTKNPDGSYAYTTTDLVSAVAGALSGSGQAMTFETGSQLGTLFGIARAADQANSNLFNADPGSAITSDMLSAWPTAASIGVQDAQPEYFARASFTYLNALGETSQGWVSLTGLTQLPPSQANLLNRLQGAAMTSYSVAPDEGGSPTSDAEVMQAFGEFTDVQLYAV